EIRMLIEPGDGVRLFARNGAGRREAVAGKHDGKAAAPNHIRDLPGHGVANSEAGRYFAGLFRGADDLANILHRRFMAVKRKLIGKPPGDNGVRALTEAAVIMAAIVGREDNAYVHEASCPTWPRSMARASAGSMRPSYSARPEMAPASFRASGCVMRRMSSREARPPEAMTGIVTAFASSMVEGQLMPVSTPSRSMSV